MTLSPGESRYVSYSHQYDNQYTSAANAYFQSSDPSICTVSSSGKVTAKKPGTTYINVYSKISSASPYCKVTVTKKSDHDPDPDPNPDPNPNPDPSKNDYEIIDLGLSINWASKNVGAKRDYDQGDYFAWGETATKSSFTESNSKTYYKNMFDSSEFKNNNCCLVPSMDAAYVNMGAGWRMPTLQEIDELINRCEWIYTNVKGTNGYNVTGPSGDSIFLPVTDKQSNVGYYWIGSSFSSPYDADAFRFFKERKGMCFTGKRYKGYCVRGVTKEEPQTDSGIGTVISDTKNWTPYGTIDGIIISEKPIDQTVTVYSMMGTLVYSGFNEYIEVHSSGIYIVKIGDSSYKVYVP